MAVTPSELQHVVLETARHKDDVISGDGMREAGGQCLVWRILAWMKSNAIVLCESSCDCLECIPIDIGTFPFSNTYYILLILRRECLYGLYCLVAREFEQLADVVHL